LSPGEILERSRLADADLRGICTPARVALAMRGEWWHGTLEGANGQARRGVATFIGSPNAWKAPALVYLAYGRSRLADLVGMNLSEIQRECAARLAASRATTGNLGLAATHLVELADVLGPIVALHPDPQLRALAAARRPRLGSSRLRPTTPTSGWPPRWQTAAELDLKAGRISGSIPQPGTFRFVRRLVRSAYRVGFAACARAGHGPQPS
jgi:hypothetical protein